MASQALLAMPMVPHNLDLSMTDIRNPGAHLGGLFGYHDRPLCTAGTQH